MVSMNRLVTAVVAAALLAAATACGSSDDGGKAGPAVSDSLPPLPSAHSTPVGKPTRQTTSVERGTTNYVGGLRLGVMGVRNGTGIVKVLEGPKVPADGWVVRGGPGLTKKLGNGWTVTIDEVVEGKPSDKTGSGGASVTVTVVPPA